MTANETLAPARWRYLGVTDECVQCEKCGKADLRATIMIVPLDADGNDDGDPVYFGSTCAARALHVRGRSAGRRVLQSARWAHEQTKNGAEDARRMLAHYGLPETGDADRNALQYARLLYQTNHRFASWFDEKTPEQWTAMVADMLTRKQAAIADARALKIPGF